MTSIAVATLMLGLGVVAAVVAMRTSRAHKATLQALRARPLLDPSSADGADVVVIGRVKHTGETLVGPLSARSCVAYRSRVCLGLMGGSRVRERAGILPFAIETLDGKRVVIDSAHVQFVFPSLPLPPGSEDRCRDFAIAHAVASGDRARATYEEVLVFEGMKIAVAGRVERRDDTVRLVGDSTTPIIIGVPF